MNFFMRFSQFLESQPCCATDDQAMSLFTLLTPEYIGRYRNSAQMYSLPSI